MIDRASVCSSEEERAHTMFGLSADFLLAAQLGRPIEHHEEMTNKNIQHLPQSCAYIYTQVLLFIIKKTDFVVLCISITHTVLVTEEVL